MTESAGSHMSDSSASMRSGARLNIVLLKLAAWLPSTLYLNEHTIHKHHTHQSVLALNVFKASRQGSSCQNSFHSFNAANWILCNAVKSICYPLMRVYMHFLHMFTMQYKHCIIPKVDNWKNIIQSAEILSQKPNLCTLQWGYTSHHTTYSHSPSIISTKQITWQDTKVLMTDMTQQLPSILTE